MLTDHDPYDCAIGLSIPSIPAVRQFPCAIEERIHCRQFDRITVDPLPVAFVHRDRYTYTSGYVAITILAEEENTSNEALAQTIRKGTSNIPKSAQILARIKAFGAVFVDPCGST